MSKNSEIAISMVSLVIGIIAIIVSITIPEARALLNLDNEKESFVPSNKNIKSELNTLTDELNLLSYKGDLDCKNIQYSANCGFSFLWIKKDGKFMYYHRCAHDDQEYLIGRYQFEGNTIICQSEYIVYGLAYIDTNKPGLTESESFSYRLIASTQPVKISLSRNECIDYFPEEPMLFSFKLELDYSDGRDHELRLGHISEDKSIENYLKEIQIFDMINKAFNLL